MGPVIAGAPASYLPALLRAAERRRRSHRAVLRAGPGRFHGFVTYQPAGRYWTFQGIETGIFVALAAILLTVTAVVLLRRDAWHTAQARR